MDGGKAYFIRVGPVPKYRLAQHIKDLLNHQPVEDNPHHSDTKLWNLRNADIRAVITEISNVTGKNFII